MLNEKIDLSGMSDVDYTDTFSSIDENAEMVSAFADALRRDMRITNAALADRIDVGSSDLISMDDDPDAGRIMSWDADKVLSMDRWITVLYCSVLLKDGAGGLRRFTEKYGVPWRIKSRSGCVCVKIITKNYDDTLGAPSSVDGIKNVQEVTKWPRL